MTVEKLTELLNADAFCVADGKREVTDGYAGDFLSFVIGKAPDNCAWFTVMNNVNVCAVATLADVSAVVLCEGVKPDENLAAKVKQQNVNLICTDLDIFDAVKAASAEI